MPAPTNLPILLTWLRIVAIPLIIGNAIDTGVTIVAVDNTTGGTLSNFQPTTSSTAGGGVTYKFDFYKHVDTGSPTDAVILQNVKVNAKRFDPEHLAEHGAAAAVAVGLALRKAGDR